MGLRTVGSGQEGERGSRRDGWEWGAGPLITVIAVIMFAAKHKSKHIGKESKHNNKRRVDERRTYEGIRRGLICVLAASLLMIPVEAAIRVPQSQQEQLRLLTQNGIPYARAATRIVSDTPISIARQTHGAGSGDGIIQQEMTRLTRQGMAYARAATRSVASDRLPICMTTKGRDSQMEPTKESKEDRDRGEIAIWSLNVRGMSSEARLKELEQEA